MNIDDPNKVPKCRSCGIGHWTDCISEDGFCVECTEARKQVRPEGYYWVYCWAKDKDDKFIDYYGPTTGIDQLNREERIITSWDWEICNKYDYDEMPEVISGPIKR
jgi:hypothetical protein